MGWASKHIERLKAGEPVSFRPHGNSMTPRIKSGELCTVTPFAAGEDPAAGDVVLCTVGGHQYLHLVSAIQGERYQISNAHKHVNGWTSRSQIHGKLTTVAT